MQDEIVARLAGALNAQLVAAEARRAEQAPTPDLMDLYFQGLAWFNKGGTPTILRKRAAFSIGRSPPIPAMSTRLLDRRARTRSRRNFLCGRSRRGLRRGRSEVDQGLSLVPDHARGHQVIYPPRGHPGGPQARQAGVFFSASALNLVHELEQVLGMVAEMELGFITFDHAKIVALRKEGFRLQGPEGGGGCLADGWLRSARARRIASAALPRPGKVL